MGGWTGGTDDNAGFVNSPSAAGLWWAYLFISFSTLISPSSFPFLFNHGEWGADPEKAPPLSPIMVARYPFPFWHDDIWVLLIVHGGVLP